MVDLAKITKFLDKELNINEELGDLSHNGLQVEMTGDVKKIGFAVDASMQTFKKAKKEGCNLLIVHHGLFWNRKERIINSLYKQIQFLIENNIGLYGVHLPLDKHKKYGNNAGLFKLLGAVPQEIFGEVGYIGEFKTPKKFEDIVRILNKKINAKCKILKYGPKKVKKIAIVSGGATWDVFDAITKKADMFITGEISHGVYHPVKEAKIHYVDAGHYATETVGVKALIPVLNKKFKIRTVFLDVPTGL